MTEDSQLRSELFDWYTSLIPTQVECHPWGPVIWNDPSASSKQNSIGSTRKLALVLDLDLTLVHAKQLSDFTHPFDPALLGKVSFGCDSDNPQIFCLWLDEQPYIIKLRPGVRQFLRELAPLYELNIFTKATRPYLNFIRAALDPDCELFAKSISRDDATDLDINTKVMSLVSARPLTELVVFDDRQSVWRECQENVIRAEPYVYLDKKMTTLGAAINNSTGVCEDPDRHLDAIKEVLKSIHQEYAKGGCDVRQVIKSVRSRALLGCRIMFSGVPKDELPEYMAAVASLGGEVTTNEDDLPTDADAEPKLTHLIVVGGGKYNTKKVYDARKFNGRVKVVHGAWLQLAVSIWRRPDEASFDLARFAYDFEGKVAIDVDPWEYFSK